MREVGSGCAHEPGGGACARVCRLGRAEEGEQFGATSNLRARWLKPLPLFACGHEPTRLIERGFQTRRAPERSVEERIAEVSPCRAVFASERGPVGSGSRDYERARVSECGHEDARVAGRDYDNAIP